MYHNELKSARFK